MWRVHQHGGAGRGVAEDLVAADEAPLAARDKLGGAHEPRRVDGLRTETQVRDGDGAGFLGVVNEVALGEEVGLFADDLDGVFIRADGAVRAETNEDATTHARGLELEGLVPAQRRVGDIVVDADGEPMARAGGVEVGENTESHRGGEFLGAETIAAADHAAQRHGDGSLGLGESREHGEIERFAGGAGLLGAIEHAEGADGGGQGAEEGGDGERLKKADGDDADAAAVGVEMFGGGLDRLDAAAHAHDDVLGLRVAVVFNE